MRSPKLAARRSLFRLRSPRSCPQAVRWNLDLDFAAVVVAVGPVGPGRAEFTPQHSCWAIQRPGSTSPQPFSPFLRPQILRRSRSFHLLERQTRPDCLRGVRGVLQSGQAVAGIACDPRSLSGVEGPSEGNGRRRGTTCSGRIDPRLPPSSVDTLDQCDRTRDLRRDGRDHASPCSQRHGQCRPRGSRTASERRQPSDGVPTTADQLESSRERVFADHGCAQTER